MKHSWKIIGGMIGLCLLATIIVGVLEFRDGGSGGYATLATIAISLIVIAATILLVIILNIIFYLKKKKNSS